MKDLEPFGSRRRRYHLIVNAVVAAEVTANGRQHLRVVVDGQDYWFAHGVPGIVVDSDPIRVCALPLEVRFATLIPPGERGGGVVEDTRLVVLGSRGSIAVSGSEFVRYGGNTTSFALVVGDETVAFIDAGTGLVAYRSLGLEPASSVHIFLTHYHWDHIQGLSMFGAVWADDGEVVIHGPGGPEQVVTAAIAPPWFPVALAGAGAVRYETVSRPVDIRGLVITPFRVEHPQGAFGYRVDGPSASLAIVTDHEAGTERDASIVESIRGVDFLIHDAQYRPDEIANRRGWGHSTWVDAVVAADAAGAKRLLLTSLDPGSTDRDVDGILRATQERFPEAGIARPGLEVRL